jgi:hypothetical protein
MKYEIIKIIGIVLSGIFGVIFAGYLIIGFMLWVFSDPLNLNKIELLPTYQNPDVIKCREMGGYPITSGWDGSLKECKKLELK